MTVETFLDVLNRHPEIAAGLPDHPDEVATICARIVEIVEIERNPPTAPTLPADAPDWEHAYWRRRRGDR